MVFCARIVGDDDGGVLFSPEQYEEYKRRVVPMVSKTPQYSWHIHPLICKLMAGKHGFQIKVLKVYKVLIGQRVEWGGMSGLVLTDRLPV